MFLPNLLRRTALDSSSRQTPLRPFILLKTFATAARCYISSSVAAFLCTKEVSFWDINCDSKSGVRYSGMHHWFLVSAKAAKLCEICCVEARSFVVACSVLCFNRWEKWPYIQVGVDLGIGVWERDGFCHRCNVENCRNRGDETHLEATRVKIL